MSTLDQAFIKAYGHRETLPVAAPLESAQPVLLADANARAESFQPQFRVDSVCWPEVCNRLNTASPGQVDRLADHLLEGAGQGRKMVAIAGCRQREGATTLLLALARRLAGRGPAVALLDADFDCPQLARQLGLLPEVGWDEVLADGASPAEAMVESVEDRLGILPLREPRPEGSNPPRVPAQQQTIALGALRQYFDLVLIDLGAFGGRRKDGSLISGETRRWIDAVVLVRDVRSTPPAELTHTRRRLHELGLAEAGVVENFA